MSNITGEEIEKLLKKAWSDFFKYYESEVRECSKNMSKAETFKEHWIIWNEADLMVQLALNFKEQLAKNPPSVEIEMHFDKNLTATKPSNFDGYSFEDKLIPLRKELRRKQGPKVDLIIAKKNDTGPFLLCAEAKFFHYDVGRYRRTPQKDIQKDINTLVAIKDSGIAERVVFMLFDDYYCHRDQEKYKEIMSILAEAEEHKLTILKHP